MAQSLSSTDPVNDAKSASPLTTQNETTATMASTTTTNNHNNDTPINRRNDKVLESIKFLLSLSFFLSSIYTTYNFNHSQSFSNNIYNPGNHDDSNAHGRRRLSVMTEDADVPLYMNDLMANLRERQKLFEDTPPEEVKYWFEYTGPLQVSE